MKYTPYDGFTSEELISAVIAKSDPTDLEIALMERLEHLLDDIEELHEIRERDVEGVPV